MKYFATFVAEAKPMIGGRKASLAIGLISALVACSLPVRAQGIFSCPGSGTVAIDCQLTNALGSNNSTNSGTSSSGSGVSGKTVAIAAAAGGAAVGLLIVYMVKKRHRAQEEDAQSAPQNSYRSVTSGQALTHGASFGVIANEPAAARANPAGTTSQVLVPGSLAKSSSPLTWSASPDNSALLRLKNTFQSCLSLSLPEQRLCSE